MVSVASISRSALDVWPNGLAQGLKPFILTCFIPINGRIANRLKSKDGEYSPGAARLVKGWVGVQDLPDTDFG